MRELIKHRKIWKSMKTKDISKKGRSFIWMCTHDAYMIGNHWNKSNNPDLNERKTCKYCNKIESKEHIICECKAPGQETIWKLAEENWKKRDPNWEKPNLGTIIGCSAIKLTNPQRQQQHKVYDSHHNINIRISTPHMETTMCKNYPK